jgi:UDP-glucuronate 4-epimerase
LLKDKFGQFDAIYHLAGLAGVRQSLDNPLGYIAQNVLGLQRMLDWAREGIARRVVYASSSSVYSPTHEWPMGVGQDDVRPRTPYAASKRMMELLAHAYHKSYDVESVGLRYFSVYGPAGRPDSRASIFQYVRQIIEREEITIYGDAQQARDFTHVCDAVNMTRLVGESPAYAKRCDVLNAGFGVPRRVLEVIRWISDIVAVHPVVRFVTDSRTDTRHTWAEVEQEFIPLKANQIDFGHGLRQCVDWYQANRDWAKEIKP